VFAKHKVVGSKPITRSSQVSNNFKVLRHRLRMLGLMGSSAYHPPITQMSRKSPADERAKDGKNCKRM
jgi:hypothetical protein